MELQLTGLLDIKILLPGNYYVETYVGISGKKEGLPQLPDGNFFHLSK